MKTLIRFILSAPDMRIVGVASILGIIFWGCYSFDSTRNTPVTETELAVKRAVDSMRLVGLRALELQKDSLVKMHEGKAQESHQRAAVHINNTSVQSAITSGLTASYEKEKTLPTCDSLVNSLRIENAEKDSTIEDVSAEAIEYSSALRELKGVVAVKDTTNKILTDRIQDDSKYMEILRASRDKEQRKTKTVTGIAAVIVLIETVLLLLK